MLSRFKIPFFLMAMLAMPQAFLLGQQRIDGFSGLEWYKIIGNYTSNFIHADMEQAEDGSIYYAGHYNSQLYIGPYEGPDTLFQDTIQDSPYDNHAFIVKLDDQGVFQWVWIARGDSISSSYITDFQIDKNGNLCLLGYFSGMVHFPSGQSFQTYSIYKPNGFLVRISSSGMTTSVTRIGSAGTVVTGNVFCENSGATNLVLSTSEFPIMINQDTLLSDSPETFLAVIKLDSNGRVLSWGAFEEGNKSEGGYVQSAMDSSGNLILEFWLYGIPSWDSGSVTYRGISHISRGYQLAKLNGNLNLEWIRRTNRQPKGWGNVVDATSNGDIFYSSEDDSSWTAFLEKYDSEGNLQWTLMTGGYSVIPQDMFVTEDFIYWTGYYQCEMTVDTIRFRIGDTQPSPWPARDGFICLVNKHTGKVAWAMSEADSLENKHFSKIVAVKDDHAFIAAEVTTSSCTIDTLELLNIAPSALPYMLLFKLNGLPSFPEWPEVSDTVDFSLDFTLWPNPTSGEFTISVTDLWSANLTMEVYNPAGQLLLRKNLQERQSMIDPEGVASGVVFVKLKDNEHGNMRTKQLVLIR